MFDMFRGGKPDPMTLMAVEHEQRQTDLRRVVNYIKKNYSVGDSINPDEVAAILRIDPLTDSEIEEIEHKLMG